MTVFNTTTEECREMECDYKYDNVSNFQYIQAGNNKVIAMVANIAVITWKKGASAFKIVECFQK